MLTFTLCEKCGKHGRFTGTPDEAAVEVGSKCLAMVILDAAVMAGGVPSEEIQGFVMTILNSKMADVEDIRDVDGQDGAETYIDPELREHIAIWNQAAIWTNDRKLFALSDFHDYVELLKTPARRSTPPQPN
ncbi:MAG: hypothetical protein QY323_04920 [Patescibacteria group bacterium]|nr:MAG: hypothetical protein QY323_04920 [Patescibacteria group bacterium]